MDERLPDDGEIDIEEIMAEIRQQLMSQQVGPGMIGLDLPLTGQRFSPEFYEQMYLAGMESNDMHIYLDVTPSNIPLLGPLLDRFRQALHQVVLFYVHKVVERQAGVNRHLLKALSALSEELENEQAPPDDDA